MKYFIYSSLSLLLSGTAFAQSIERQVFNSFGTVTQSGGMMLTTNVGEPLTKTYSVGNTILTQGFLQPEPKDLTMDFSEPGSTTVSVHIWPNPTTEGLYISYENVTAADGRIMIYDMAGKSLLIEPICVGCTQQYLPLPSLADGIYVVRLALTDNMYKDQKFIKVSQ